MRYLTRPIMVRYFRDLPNAIALPTGRHGLGGGVFVLLGVYPYVHILESQSGARRCLITRYGEAKS